MKRADFITAVTSFLGTPFHHQGRVPGIGLDCAGLPICALQHCGETVDDVTDYGPEPDPTALLARVGIACSRITDAREGDIVCFCWYRGGPAQHFGVLVNGGLHIIHTSNKVGRVLLEPFDAQWQRRVHSYWRLKCMED